jgi:hypothetical protein
MRKMLASLLLSCLLAASASAGDMNYPKAAASTGGEMNTPKPITAEGEMNYPLVILEWAVMAAQAWVV